ncbi:hypothetical protein evm_003631 [Chilo suppressalis]|nr:hypothetical protein evm_003631 [Chilo suppressalis]
MTRSPDILFMTDIDDILIYENYYSDFGPLNLGCVYKYCKILNEKLKLYFNKQVIVHYTSTEPNKKANAAFVLGCYGILCLNLCPRDALKPLLVHGQNYRSFQDATQGESQHTITLIDCLQAMKKARDLGLFNLEDFNYEEYDRLDKIQGGDLNWIVPGKFLAFIGPVDFSLSFYHPPEMYIDYFRDNGVNIVIRLNKKLYNGKVFSNAGITHYDLYFPDGSCPPRNILFKFLQISEDSDGAIAVHCKAGLGRTGSLIGCYIIKHYRMTAREAIGWMRICRPGSVIGQQQDWLEQLEPWLMKQGNFYRKRTYGNEDRFPTHPFGVYSIAEKVLKHKPIVFNKSSSSSPIQRQTRSDISPPLRIQVSRPKEALHKTVDKDASDRRMRKSNVKQNSYAPDQKDTNSIARRGVNGGGDPRSISPSRGSIARTSQSSAKSNESPARNNTMNYQTQIPTFRTSQGPVIKTINDARNFLMRSTIGREDRARGLKAAVTVTPTSSRPPQYDIGKLAINSTAHVMPTSYTSATRCVTQPQHRRRLGRSPSPPQVRMHEQSRATNTPPSYAGKFLLEDASKTVLKEELSRLKLVTARDGSMRAASIGAASLGARRDAPTPKRAPSVHSDERDVATQGDLLNSIKFQRRFRNSLVSEKLTGLVHDKIGVITKEKASIKDVNSKTSAAGRGNLQNHESCCQRDRTYATSRSVLGSQRPSSPKGRQRQTMYH